MRRRELVLTGIIILLVGIIAGLGLGALSDAAEARFDATLRLVGLLTSVHNLGDLLKQQGKFGEAEELLRLAEPLF